MSFPAPGGELDLQERTVFRVRLGDVDDEVVREQELGQRVRAVLVCRPVGLAVQTVPEREVRVQPGPVRALVGVAEVERVVHVVQVADLKVAVHRVELLRREHQVGHLGPPGALEADVEAAARQGLRDHADQLSAAGQHGAVDLDHQAQDVLAVKVDRARVCERELSGGDRLQRRGRIHDERIPPRAREHADAVDLAAMLVVHPDRDRCARRRGARAFLPWAVRTVSAHGGREHAVDHDLFAARDEWRPVIPIARGERPQPEAVDEPVREERRRRRERQCVQHQDEPA